MNTYKKTGEGVPNLAGYRPGGWLTEWTGRIHFAGEKRKEKALACSALSDGAAEIPDRFEYDREEWQKP